MKSCSRASDDIEIQRSSLPEVSQRELKYEVRRSDLSVPVFSAVSEKMLTKPATTPLEVRDFSPHALY